MMWMDSTFHSPSTLTVTLLALRSQCTKPTRWISKALRREQVQGEHMLEREAAGARPLAQVLYQGVLSTEGHEE